MEVDIPQNLIDIIKNAHSTGDKNISTENTG
jgi:hypothetical protein